MAKGVSELFGFRVSSGRDDWESLVFEQNCPFTGKKCIKTRKSRPDVAIGTCVVKYGRPVEPVIICPHRLLERRQIFLDCVHLLTLHEPGNELHVVPEFQIPGGNVDFVLVSVGGGKVVDFVGIELQTLDTTGTVWPARQQALQSLGFDVPDGNGRSYGMNWKMTAKTILMQLHHKIATFGGLNRHLVLVIQNQLDAYMGTNFDFSEMRTPTRLGDPLHFHVYSLVPEGNEQKLAMVSRRSTDADGLAIALGQSANPDVALGVVLAALQTKVGPATLLAI